MKMLSKIIQTIFLAILAQSTFAQLSPVITCWQQNTTEIGFADALTNVQAVNYSETYAYVKTEDIPFWIPIVYDWPNNPWFAVPMNYQFRFRLNPTPNVGPETKTGYGHIGLWKNGSSIYNPKDAKSFEAEEVWFQNAWYWEHLLGETFDHCLGHPNGSGEYHTHVSPACLYNIEDSLQVSPLIGYGFDSYPIYGGYGYEDPMNTTSAIVRLKSSYRLRNITDRTVLPDGTVLPASQYGPAIGPHNSTSTNVSLDDSPLAAPLGTYMEDYEYVEGLGDLDEHNGRLCITTDYPEGTYAYFTTLDWVTDIYGTGIKPVFPFVIGTAYYGEVYPMDGNTGPNSGFVEITEPVTPYVYTVASITAEESSLEINIYPNPISNLLNIQVNGGNPLETMSASIFNINAALVNRFTIVPGIINSYKVGKLANGIYYLQLRTSTNLITHRLVVTK
ncbi:MAG: hypothetical protein ACI9EQ_002067 [Bacteroidia bacterium]|jgi:hypothetical protein